MSAVDEDLRHGASARCFDHGLPAGWSRPDIDRFPLHAFLLEQLHGPSAVRAPALGVHENVWFHGTYPLVDSGGRACRAQTRGLVIDLPWSRRTASHSSQTQSHSGMPLAGRSHVTSAVGPLWAIRQHVGGRQHACAVDLLISHPWALEECNRALTAVGANADDR